MTYQPPEKTLRIFRTSKKSLFAAVLHNRNQKCRPRQDLSHTPATTRLNYCPPTYRRAAHAALRPLPHGWYCFIALEKCYASSTHASFRQLAAELDELRRVGAPLTGSTNQLAPPSSYYASSSLPRALHQPRKVSLLLNERLSTCLSPFSKPCTRNLVPTVLLGRHLHTASLQHTQHGEQTNDLNACPIPSLNVL